jgi:hypothetical protein
MATKMFVAIEFEKNHRDAWKGGDHSCIAVEMSLLGRARALQ